MDERNPLSSRRGVLEPGQARGRERRTASDAAAPTATGRGRRPLSLAAIVDGMRRADAARVGGMDGQTPRDGRIASMNMAL